MGKILAKKQKEMERTTASQVVMGREISKMRQAGELAPSLPA